MTEPAGPPGSLLAQLRGLAPTLVPSTARVATVILNDPGSAARMTIGELAAAAGTSETTVLRLCREVGVGGYRAFRTALVSEQGRAAGRADDRELPSEIDRNDSLEQIISKITYADSRAVAETADLIEIGELAAVVEAITAARRVDVFGVGASAFVAMDLAQKLHRIGVICFNWSDQHTALTAAALLGPGDVAIGISHTGATKDTVETITRARSTGAMTVAITAVPRSRLGSAAEHRLITASRETTFRSGAMASRIAALSLVDVLFVAVAQRTYDRTAAALDATRRAVAIRRFGRSDGRQQ